MARTFLEGNEAVARGAVAAGCEFFAGYPITPATSPHLRDRLHLTNRLASPRTSVAALFSLIILVSCYLVGQ